MAFYHLKNGDFEYLISPLLQKEGVKHCFTTKNGGASKGHLESLNLSVSRETDMKALSYNYDVVGKALSFNIKGLSTTNQVHGVKVGVINEPTPIVSEADALITNKSAMPIACFSADCVPILLYDKKNKAIGAVHSGWRGTVDRILTHTIRAMEKEFGTKGEDLICAIGPSICKNCFLVKEDVREPFSKAFPEMEIKKVDDEHYSVDLWEAVKITLLENGVKEENIDFSAECTAENDDIYFSCRKSKGKFGTMGAFIELE